MRPAYYRQQWALIKESPDPAQLQSLAQRIAAVFIDRYLYSDEYNADYIELICEMATCCKDPSLNQIAARILFGTIVERLCDDFEELQTETYNRLICQVASYLRRLPEGGRLDAQLNAFHLHNEEQLYQRIESMRLSPDSPLPPGLNPRRVLVLSRVTIGADVAVTSVICQRVQQRFPGADVVVLGNAKLRQIMAPESGIRVRELHYARHGGLVERFSVWLDLVAVVNEELDGLSAQEYLVLDPDSRLTQLGVLPLVAEQQYRFFNSRGKPDYPVKGSISALSNHWLDAVLGAAGFCYPGVWLAPQVLRHAQRFLQPQGRAGKRHVITLNLGVGGNMRKRVPGGFELDLVLSLLRETDTLVLLDMGFGEEETRRSHHILEAARAAGYNTTMLPYRALEASATGLGEVRLFGIECDVGEIAALIACSDEFIGYDSACQHIGAALGVRTYTVFAGTSNARFIRRWHASGPNVSEIVYVDTLSREHEVNAEELIARLYDLRKN
ncbi:MAG: hypothetical protein H7A05_03610 [Pseudomonadales bacterium]|nr:hypothetical protein [Pseudomonadales bacterium]MCP5329779.1 hypothetical protein [Pseudomonadales bacterium]MCP5343684.1 hypothetical protein [Pseudomonadales bacterium]